MTWDTMSPVEKVAWLRVWAVRNDYDATASDCRGRNAPQKRHALTAAALTDLADRIERDERRRETARYHLARGDAPWPKT